MDDRLIKKLKMFINLKRACTAHREIWMTIPAFVNFFDEFSENLEKLSVINAQLQSFSTGTTEAKNKQKEQMAEDIMILAGAIRSYALSKDDSALLKDVNINISAILKMKETDADDLCMSILTKTKGILKELKDFGIGKPEIDAATASIGAFSGMIGGPKYNINEHKSLNEQSLSLFKICDKLLEQMDHLMPRFKSKEEVFYNKYFSARRIGGNGTGPKNDEGDGEPI